MDSAKRERQPRGKQVVLRGQVAEAGSVPLVLPGFPCLSHCRPMNSYGSCKPERSVCLPLGQERHPTSIGHPEPDALADLTPRAVLYGFGKVWGVDRLCPHQISDRARQLQYAGNTCGVAANSAGARHRPAR